jgi:hypothetical protein
MKVTIVKRKKISLSVSLVVLLLSAITCTNSSRRFAGNSEARSLTRDLPTIDTVELMELERVGDLWNGEVTASRIVEGDEAQRIASLWREQVYLADSAVCHNPAYAIKFSSRQKLIAYATLCWDCDNIEFIEPKLTDYQGFAGEAEGGQRLLRIFESTVRR